MRRLVEDLLILTRLDEGRITMRMEHIAVAPFLLMHRVHDFNRAMEEAA